MAYVPGSTSWNWPIVAGAQPAATQAILAARPTGYAAFIDGPAAFSPRQVPSRYGAGHFQPIPQQVAPAIHRGGELLLARRTAKL